MNQDPEHEDYDDDDYKYYPQDDKSIPFSFDWNTWELWLSNVLKEIITEEKDDISWTFTFPTYTHQKHSTKKTENIDKKEANVLYFGKNKHDEAIWKTKYFESNFFNEAYKNHFSSHASHIVRQPSYYQGMFDILN